VPGSTAVIADPTGRRKGSAPPQTMEAAMQTTDDTNNVVSLPPPKNRCVSKPAAAGVHEDDDRFYLQIELQHDCALTLSYPKTGNGDPPAVTVWTGNGEHDFGDDLLAAFRAWAELATGWKTPDEYSKALEELYPRPHGAAP
jgi:hypothetical protein